MQHRPLIALSAAALTAALLCLTPQLCAKPKPYFADTAIDLSRLLAPPPAPSSEEGKREFAELESLQKSRTPADIAAAQADADISVFRFADVLGADSVKFSADALPITKKFFKKVVESGEGVSENAKRHFARPRPFTLDTALHPVLGRPQNASYPSGHSIGGNLIAIVLADIIPEKRAEIFARGRAFAHQRAVGGVHYPSDLEAGRISAAVVAARLYHDKDFREDLEKARQETRAALGLK